MQYRSWIILAMFVCGGCGMGLTSGSDNNDPNAGSALNACKSATQNDLRIGINAGVIDHISAVSGADRRANYDKKFDELDVFWQRTLYWNRNNAMSPKALESLKNALLVRRNKGVRTLLIMGTTALPQGLPDYYTGTDDEWDTYKAAFVSEMERSVDALGGVVEAWQLFNEPNLGGTGANAHRGVMPAHRFRELVNAGAAVVRAKDPSATVVGPGLVTYKGKNDDATVDTYGPYYLQQATKNERLDVDVLAFHTYSLINVDHLSINTNDLKKSNLRTAWQNVFNNYLAKWSVSVKDATTKSPRFWVTEFGGPLERQKVLQEKTATVAEIEAYHANALKVGFGLWQDNAPKGLERAFFFSYSDFEGHPGEDLGLVSKNIAPRNAAFTGFDALTSEFPVEKRCSVERSKKYDAPPVDDPPDDPPIEPPVGDKPDLIVEQITLYPTAPKVGDQVTVKASVRNVGKAENKADITVNFQFNDDQSTAYVATVSTLKPNEQAEVIMQGVWSPTSKGQTWIQATIDAQNKIDESNEGNNKKDITITVEDGTTMPPDPKGKPDLLIENISVSPASPKVGEDVVIRATIKNQGETVEGQIGIGFKVNGNGFHESYALHNRLQKGASAQVTMIAKWKPTKKGDAWISATIDDQNKIEESNEGNNNKTLTVNVKDTTVNPPDPNKADLVAKDITFYPSNPKVGDMVLLQVVVQNQSNITSHNRVGVDFLIDGQNPNQSWGVHQNALSSWQTVTINMDVRWRPSWAGQHKIKVIVDDLDETKESDEQNNVKEIDLTVQ